ncbi:MAG: glycine--tRNA ligase subunit beta [Rhodobacteraceae bacterium]|nr:glycine--tRNA ligase subunit beta [Paracoccaceae bacterium]
MADLLLELLSEEIPASMQRRAGDDLARLVTAALADAGLRYDRAQAFVTPRRLCLRVEGLADRSPDIREHRRGPRADAPDRAVEGFCRGAGVPRAALEIREDRKGRFFYATLEQPGRPAAAIIAGALPGIIRNFPWPKSMRWGAGTLRWIRPLHSILCMLGADVVTFEAGGITSGNTTRGHRFHAPDEFAVTGCADYRARLAAAYVMPDSQVRADVIREGAANMARARGLEVVDDPGLLQEVAGLVEWPVVLMGRVRADFLNLPSEVLQISMKEHQKFFSVRNPGTGRIERFITVANRATADRGATILAGNEKVLAARLSDAQFFWENDLRKARAGMGEWLGALRDVTFERHLGSVAARVDRIAVLARIIAPPAGADPDAAAQAARIAQADLASEMVQEFPVLQGVMGRYYAQAAGFAPEIAAVAEEHYQPLGPSDNVPTAPLSVAVALAEKIDKLIGFWAIDEKPTGSKDPFALRRAALGVIRIVQETAVRINLVALFEEAVHGLYASLARQFSIFEGNGDRQEGKAHTRLIPGDYSRNSPGPKWVVFESPGNVHLGDNGKACADGGAPLPYLLKEPGALALDLLAFFHDRLKVHLRDQGIRHDVLDACLAMPGNDDLTMLVRRARALEAFVASAAGENLRQGYRRAANILAQAEEKDGVTYACDADPNRAEAGEERRLFAALDAAEAVVRPAMNAEDFAAAMTAMAALRAPIDAFLEAVHVTGGDDSLRRNRMNLLSRIRNVMGQVADFSRLEG